MPRFALMTLALAALLGQPAAFAQPSLQSGSVFEAAQRLRAGEFLCAPDVAIVSLMKRGVSAPVAM